jgi:hypothetical protein
MSTLRGGCHCGNIRVEFETAVAPGALSLRTWQCSFCRKHGARYASDPDGRLTIRIRDAAVVLRYRFALGVTDFLSCRTCGVYVAATTTGGPEDEWVLGRDLDLVRAASGSLSHPRVNTPVIEAEGEHQ